MTINRIISIWFFIGCLLCVYGILILAAGFNTHLTSGTPQVAMQTLHLQLWWGMGLLVLGAGYAIHFRPR